MPISSADKTKAKRHVMKIVEPFLINNGFTKSSTTEYLIPLRDMEGRLLFQVPTFAPFYRLSLSIEHPSQSPILGPNSDSYAAPNSPNGIRYNFRFHLSPDTYERCASNITQWITDVAIPWFHNPRSRTSQRTQQLSARVVDK